MKLDLGPAARAEEPAAQAPVHIPWSYGLDRVTAAAVDPEKLHVYWEVTDQAIEQARAGLGPGGPDAWLSLRVYDTSGLIFDGTNAHGYFDHAVDRSDRQWFFAVGKPSSTAFVEVGMKSPEGFFVKIARSGRVDFPRAEPAPFSDPEWMTVLATTGEARREGTGAPSRRAPAPLAVPNGEPPTPFTPIPLWVLREPATDRDGRARVLLEHGEYGGERVEWLEVAGEGWYEREGHLEWQGPLTVTTWQAGPFAYPVEIDPPLRQEWQGRSFAYKVGDVTHVVHGPWQVVIRNLGAHEARAELGRWEVYRSWVAESGGEVRVVARPGHASMVKGASELIPLGASERRWLGASELRLGGASELLFAGASQLVLAGASERRFLGASELRMRGASERRLGGASERVGASERRLGGASERMGGSERRPGGSEQRFEGGSATPLPYPPAAGAYPPLPGERAHTPPPGAGAHDTSTE